MSRSVFVYSLSRCSHCKAVHQLLDKYQVKYDFTHVDLLEKEAQIQTLQEIKRINPTGAFPTILIGDTVIVGYKEREIILALNIKRKIRGNPLMAFLQKWFTRN